MHLQYIAMPHNAGLKNWNNTTYHILAKYETHDSWIAIIPNMQKSNENQMRIRAPGPFVRNQVKNFKQR